MSDPKTASTSTARTTAADEAAGQAPDGARVAAEAIATWHAIAAALQPIVGVRGVEALYGRSLHLAAEAEPWLVVGVESSDVAMDLQALSDALAGQTLDRAEAGSRAVLDQFNRLLVSLVGAALIARLLADVPAMCADKPIPQEPPS